MDAHRNLSGIGCGCSDGDIPGEMIPIERAFELIDSATEAVRETEKVSLMMAHGRVLAEPVVASAMVPPFDNSAMDGYALCAAELQGDGPWILPVAARIAAGHAALDPLPFKATVRILTGAPLPEHADAVVMQEHVRCDGKTIVVSRKPFPGQNIRYAGQDMRAGALVLSSGRQLTSKEIAACAAAGRTSASVYRRIRVALLVTGDEVDASRSRATDAFINDVNTPMLASELQSQGVDLVSINHVGDDPEELAATLRSASGGADILLTTGGVSVGDADLVPGTFRDIGGRIEFDRVAIKPGKPVTFGRLGSTFWLGLPGNPVAAFVGWHLFGKRLLAQLGGVATATPSERSAVLTNALRHRPGRREYRPGRIVGVDPDGRVLVACPDATNSAAVGHLAAADGFVAIAAEEEELPEGKLVEFLALN